MDRAAAIKHGVYDKLGDYEVFVRDCSKHLQRNIGICGEEDNGFFWGAVHAKTTDQRDDALACLRVANLKAYNKLMAVPCKLWCDANFPTKTQDQSTNNIAERNVLQLTKAARKSPPVGLIKGVLVANMIRHEKLREEARQYAASSLPSPLLTKYANERFQENLKRIGNYKVVVQSASENTFYVTCGATFGVNGSAVHDERRVTLNMDGTCQSCTCLIEEEIPCSHKLAVASHLGILDSILVDDASALKWFHISFLSSSVVAAFSSLLSPAVEVELEYDDLLPVLVARQGSGRPQDKRIASTGARGVGDRSGVLASSLRRPRADLSCFNCLSVEHTSRTCPFGPLTGAERAKIFYQEVPHSGSVTVVEPLSRDPQPSVPQMTRYQKYVSDAHMVLLACTIKYNPGLLQCVHSYRYRRKYWRFWTSAGRRVCSTIIRSKRKSKGFTLGTATTKTR